MTDEIQKRPSQRLTRIVSVLILLIITLAVYRPVADFAFLKFDDNLYVTENLAVQRGLSAEGARQAFSGTVAANWHPLTMLSHMFDCTLFGLDAGSHHLVNVGIHCVNLLLLVWIVRCLTGEFLPALLTGALFALHPLRVESVAWISERKDVLSTMFWLLSIAAYGSWVNRPKWWKYLSLALFFALGLLSKAMLVTLPFTLLLLDVWPLRRFEVPDRFNDPALWRNVWRLIREKLPLFGITAAFCWVALDAQRSGGAVTDLATLSLPIRVQTALIAYVGYFGKFFWPLDLACIYPHPGSWPMWMVWGAASLLAFITGFTLAVLRTRPWWFFGWCWYLGTLIPVIGFIQIGDQWMADRYTYVPLIGPVIALAWEIHIFARKSRIRTLAASALGLVVLGFCSSLTARQLMTWKDTETLSRHAIKTTGGNPSMWTNLAIAHSDNGRFEDALREFKRVAKAKPGDPQALNNVGRVLEKMGLREEAAEYYRAAIKLNPDYTMPRKNLGAIYVSVGRDDLAVPEFEALIRIESGDPVGYFQLARILAVSPRSELRNGPRAAELAKKGCALEPKPTSLGREILAASCAAAGRLNESITALSEAADLARDQGQSTRESKLRGMVAQLKKQLR